MIKRHETIFFENDLAQSKLFLGFEDGVDRNTGRTYKLVDASTCHRQTDRQTDRDGMKLTGERQAERLTERVIKMDGCKDKRKRKTDPDTK